MKPEKTNNRGRIRTQTAQNPRAQIFKLQRSALSSEGVTWLAYNEDKSELFEMRGEVVAGEVKAIMGNRLKIFVLGHFTSDGNGGRLLSIDREVREQGW